MDPLDELEHVLVTREGGRTTGYYPQHSLSLPWVVEHASSRTLESSWKTSRNIHGMISLAGRLAAPELVVRAACACARIVLFRTGTSDARALRALEAAEAWSPERNDAEALRAAEQAMDDALDDYWSDDPAKFAVSAAFEALKSATIPRRDRVGSAAHSVLVALDAARFASERSESRPGPIDLEAVTDELANAIRGILPCPDLIALLEQAWLTDREVEAVLFEGNPPPDAVYHDLVGDGAVVVQLCFDRRCILMLEEEQIALSCIAYLKKRNADASHPLRWSDVLEERMQRKP